MKKIVFGLLLFVSFSALAQEKMKPVVRQGSKIMYTAHTTDNDVQVTISIDSLTPSFAKIGWAIEGYGNGAWVMKAKSLESATVGYWGDPTPGSDDPVPEDQIFLLLSKTNWNELQKDKKINYEQSVFTVKEPTEAQVFRLNGKAVDALLLENSGGTRIWILNDASAPIMLKIEGNTKGPNITATEVR